MAELRLYCERHNDLAAPLGLCCHAAQEYNLARDDNDEFDHWSECRMVERVLSVPGELVDPAKVDYAAARKAFFADWRENDITDTEDYGRAIRVAVDAALAIGEPTEGNK